MHVEVSTTESFFFSFKGKLNFKIFNFILNPREKIIHTKTIINFFTIF